MHIYTSTRLSILCGVMAYDTGYVCVIYRVKCIIIENQELSIPIVFQISSQV